MEDFEQEFVGWETVVVLTPALREERQGLWELEASLGLHREFQNYGLHRPCLRELKLWTALKVVF